MLEIAGYLLRGDRNRIIYIDGRPFSRRYQIDNVVNFADSLHQSWRILECACPEEIARQRLDEQTASRAHPAGNRGFRLYLDVRDRFEAIDLPKTVINTSENLENCVEKGLLALGI
jgi:hypothetical protein